MEADVVKLLRDAWCQARAAWKKPRARPVWQWAEEKRRIAKSETARPGRYRTALAPYQREPQESFIAEEVQATVLYWAKRLGKTVMIENLHGYVMDEDPKNILHVMPTLDSIKKWSEQFLTPMINAIRELREKVRPARARDSGNTIRSKKYPGGMISGIGTNSPSGFRQVQAPVVTCDEADAMSDGPEGDPVTLAFGRTENYSDSVQVVASTATRITKDTLDDEDDGEKKSGTGSRIHDWWLKSDQRKWFVQCPACRKRHVMAWENMEWPKRKDADGVVEHATREAYYQCPNCPAKWDDAMRVAAVLAGEWRATAKFTGVRGYWLNGLNTTFPPKKGYKSKLHQMAAEYLDAVAKGEAAYTAWRNTFLCLPVEDKAERVDSQPLVERREDYTPDKLPAGVAVLCGVVDVQGDRLEADVVAMGEGEETWGVEHFKVIGNPELDAVWDELKRRFEREYRREDAVPLKLDCIVVDLRHKPKRVRAWLKRCGFPRAWGVYGVDSRRQVNLTVPKKHKSSNTWSYSVNTDLAKETIFSRLKLPDMGPRYMHFAGEEHGFDEEYFLQLTAEEKRTRHTGTGHAEHFWFKVRARNEALDNRVYFLAAMDILKPSVKALLAGIAARKEQSQPKDYALRDVVAGQPPAEPPQPLSEYERRFGRRQEKKPKRSGGGFNPLGL